MPSLQSTTNSAHIPSTRYETSAEGCHESGSIIVCPTIAVRQTLLSLHNVSIVEKQHDASRLHEVKCSTLVASPAHHCSPIAGHRRLRCRHVVLLQLGLPRLSGQSYGFSGHQTTTTAVTAKKHHSSRRISHLPSITDNLSLDF